MFFYIFAALCLGHYDGPSWLINLAYVFAALRFVGWWTSFAIGVLKELRDK